MIFKSPAANQMVRALLDQYHPQMKLSNKTVLMEALTVALCMGATNGWWLMKEEDNENCLK